MKRAMLIFGVAVIPLLIAGFSMQRMRASPPAPEVSLGVMRSCAHLGALAQRIALDRQNGVALDEQRYRYYQDYLRSRQVLFESPDFALLLAFGAKGLQPVTVKNLGVQTCVAAYYGFHERTHRKVLYERALSCQAETSGTQDGTAALGDCMGREYQSLLARWWREANESGSS